MSTKSKHSRPGRKPKAAPIRLAGPVTAVVTELDPDGEKVTHHRTVDTLRMMLTSDRISRSMHDAARDFQAAFSLAALDRMPKLDITTAIRTAPGGGRLADLTDAQVGARQRVAHAMDALGGHGSPAGSCVWHVVGLQHSLREWALRQGWNGKPLRQESAQGILVAALGVLARHYGYREEGERRSA